MKCFSVFVVRNLNCLMWFSGDFSPLRRIEKDEGDSEVRISCRV